MHKKCFENIAVSDANPAALLSAPFISFHWHKKQVSYGIVVESPYLLNFG